MILAYIRNSDDDSKHMVASRQKFIIQEYIKSNNLTDEVIFVEEIGVSGKVPIYQRPKLGTFLDTVPVGTTILVADITRLGRLDHDMMKFRDDNRFNLVICNNPSITEEKNRLIFGVTSMFSDQYRRDLSKKQKEKCQEMQASITDKGYYITKSTNRKMTKLGVHGFMDKARARASQSRKEKANFYIGQIRIHLEDAQNHSESLLGMANYLNARSVKTSRNSCWSASTVKRALDRLQTL